MCIFVLGTCIETLEHKFFDLSFQIIDHLAVLLTQSSGYRCQLFNHFHLFEAKSLEASGCVRIFLGLISLRRQSEVALGFGFQAREVWSQTCLVVDVVTAEREPVFVWPNV